MGSGLSYTEFGDVLAAREECQILFCASPSGRESRSTEGCRVKLTGGEIRTPDLVVQTP